MNYNKGERSQPDRRRARRGLRTAAVVLAMLLCLPMFGGCQTSGNEEQIATISEALAKAQKEIDALKTANEATKGELEEWKTANEAAKNEIDALKNKNTEAFEKLAELAAEDQAIRDFIEAGDMFLLVEDEWVSPYNAKDVLKDGGSIRYDAECNTLTLTNVSLTVKDSFLRAYGDLILELVGENRVTVQATAGEKVGGILCEDLTRRYNLLLCGEGSLELTVTTLDSTAEAVGITAENCTVCAGELTVLVGNAVESSRAVECENASFSQSEITLTAGEGQINTGLLVNTDLSVEGGSLAVTVEPSERLSEGIWVGGNAVIDGARVQVNAKESGGMCYDVCCLGSVRLDGLATLTAKVVHAMDGLWEASYPEKIRIYIDQGHNPTGNHNSGATTDDGLDEGKMTYEIGHLLAVYLVQDGRFAVRLSRPTEDTILGTDNNSSLAARVQGAEEYEADFFISIHINAFTSDAAYGTEVYTLSGEGEAFEFGSAILQGIVDAAEMRNRGMKTKEFYVLKNTTMPSTLLELGFITNPNDAAKLQEHPEKFAEGIYNGICAYFAPAEE